MVKTIDLHNATLGQLAQNFKDLTKDVIKDILMENKMQGRLEHFERRFWLSEFISLPYGSKLDKPYLCSYIRKLTYEVEGSCYPIEKSDHLLETEITKVSSKIFQKHLEMLAH